MAIIRKQGYRNRSTALDGNLGKTPTTCMTTLNKTTSETTQKAPDNRKKHNKSLKHHYFVEKLCLQDEKT